MNDWTAGIGFVVLSNFALVGYLYYYQCLTGTVVGLPESYVVLIVLRTVVVGVTFVSTWFHMRKPDLREVFTQPKQSDSAEGE